MFVVITDIKLRTTTSPLIEISEILVGMRETNVLRSHVSFGWSTNLLVLVILGAQKVRHQPHKALVYP